jgi:hypothetical protein
MDYRENASMRICNSEKSFERIVVVEERAKASVHGRVRYCGGAEAGYDTGYATAGAWKNRAV